MYPAQTEHVLILKITPVCPSVNLDRNGIGSRMDIFRNIEFGIIVRAFAVSDLAAVDPDIEAAVDSVEMQEYLLSVPSGRNLDIPPV